jgi:hypothetical protein
MLPVVAFDTETHKIETGLLAPPMVCLTASGGEDTLPAVEAWVFGIPAEEVELLKTAEGWELLAAKEAGLDFFESCLAREWILVAHNLAYDVAVVLTERPALWPVVARAYESGLMADTKVRELLLAIADGNYNFDSRTNQKKSGYFSLAYLAEVYYQHTGLSALKKGDDIWRLRYDELDGVPLTEWPDEAKSYAIGDATWARRIWFKQARTRDTSVGPLVEDRRVVNELEQTRADLALHFMAVEGLATDPAAVAEFSAEVRETARQNDVVAQRLGFLRVNRCKACGGSGWKGEPPALTRCASCRGMPDRACRSLGVYKFRGFKPFKSSKDNTRLTQWVVHAYGDEWAPRTKKGSIKKDLETLEGSHDKGLLEYAETLSAQKLLSTYVPLLEEAAGVRLTSSPNVLVRSGRTSWRNPNMQNPPRKGKFRECFIPTPGKVFVGADYSSVECATWAQACLDILKHSKLAELLNAGVDPYVWFASVTHNKSMDEVTKTERTEAKAPILGFPGGLGPRNFMAYARGYGLDIELQRASELRNLWLDALPEARPYFKLLSQADELSYDGFPIRQLRSNRVRGGCTYTSGANTVFQGLAADGAKSAMWEITKASYADPASPLYGARPVLFIHDEFILEVAEGRASAAGFELSRIMVEEMRRYTPDVRIVAEPYISRRWYKSAEAVYNESGGLIPWEPEA